MKLLCISNRSTGKMYYNFLTVGKIYEGSLGGKFYMIRDDNGDVSLYSKRNFVTIREMRDDKLSKILG